ncbi:DUF6522 family protein [Chelativorans sp. AA-79]|uniref:DUF6522 family protein n=1 Tax=Chelativorans sp. AA-79 TaxID=3028735 RepID=UPI0023FA1DAC|nr:DUF6522 family protein [Chelativorans sp. AA-79]WEX08591.1 DUF6522 family protein [Chelativorans sp. AA-79]
MLLERNEDGFCIDAALLGDLLNVPAHRVQTLMCENEITSICEHGEGEHRGLHRLTFFYKGRRVRLDVNDAGQVLRRSTIDFGQHQLPHSLRRAGNP